MYNILKDIMIMLSEVYKLLSIMTVILRLIDLPRAYLT